MKRSPKVEDKKKEKVTKSKAVKKQITCKQCKKRFRIRKKGQQYCSEDCSHKAGPGGRPQTYNCKKAVEKLAPFLKLNYSLKKSCEKAGLSYSLTTKYLSKDTEFRKEIMYRKTYVTEAAERGIFAQIITLAEAAEKGAIVDLKDIKRYLSRVKKEKYSARLDHTTGGEKIPFYTGLPPTPYANPDFLVKNDEKDPEDTDPEDEDVDLEDLLDEE